VQMLHATPESLNKFLAMIEWELLAEFAKLTRRKPAFPEFLPGYEQLYTLADVHYQSSHFFKQHFHKILNKYPVYIKNLHNNKKLKEITNGVYSDLTSLASLKECMEQLGDYYDLEFVRVSLMAMAGADCELTDAEFIEFCDNYTLTLYELCQQDIHLSLGYSLHTHDLFALYATGGHAREQGFDDDYDMIVILDSTEQEKIDYCNKIVGKMNFHITKRGVLPHHRFADHFRSYVISIDQLAEYIGRDDENVFIDQSQILCSRMLVGSSKIEQKLQKKIIEPHVFANKINYISCLKKEMESRHAVNDDEHKSNIKECLGGCRDIEMLLLLYKVKYEVRDPLSKKLLNSLVELESENAGKFGYLRDHMRFIKKMRDLYRLKVAASNIIEEEYLPPVAAGMGYGDSRKAAENLYADFLERTALASKVINNLVDGIVAE